MCLPFDMKIHPMTKGKTVMRRFAATPGGAAGTQPVIRRHTGRGNVPATCAAKSGRGNVLVARNPNPKPHKTPKSSYSQKQHNTVIKFLLFLGSLPGIAKGPSEKHLRIRFGLILKNSGI